MSYTGKLYIVIRTMYGQSVPLGVFSQRGFAINRCKKTLNWNCHVDPNNRNIYIRNNVDEDYCEIFETELNKEL